MTKARDTANLVATGVPNSLITLDAAEIPNLDTSKITTGTLANARVADLPTSKITSGTFANVRISEGSVTQHVTATDLQPIKADLTALALREATNEASAAYNLPNQFIETFTDDTNLLTQTTGDRVSGAWQTVYSVVGPFSSDGNTRVLMHGEDLTDSSSNAHSFSSAGSIAVSSTYKKFGSTSIFFDGTDDVLLATDSSFNLSNTDFTLEAWLYPVNIARTFVSISNQPLAGASCTPGDTALIGHYNDGSTYSTGTASHWSFAQLSCGAWSTGAWEHWAITRDGTTFRSYKGGVQQSTVALATNSFLSHTNLRLGNGGCWAYYSGYADEFRFSDNCRYPSGTTFTPNQTASASATGTLIQTANTVGSAKTKVGGTMLYKDNAGTATLGTDLKIYFSCNNGGAWTEAASYNAITPVYSTGVKMVRLGETTCTSGTGVIYKAVFANQASGSKETQLHGIGINY